MPRKRAVDVILRVALVLAAADIGAVDVWYHSLRLTGAVVGDVRPRYLTALFGVAAVSALAAALLPGLRSRVMLAAGAGTVALVWGFLGGFSIGLFMLPAVPLALLPAAIEASYGDDMDTRAFACVGVAVLIALSASVAALWLP